MAMAALTTSFLLSPSPRPTPNPSSLTAPSNRPLFLRFPFSLPPSSSSTAVARSSPPSAVDALLVFCTSAALSLSLFLADPGQASAFVTTGPRRLQSDELATVRLFQENTPSVVYITNLAVRQDAFTLDVLEVPQGSGSGFVWDKDGHVVTNYHVIRGASDLKVTLADQSAYDAEVVGFDQDKDVAVLQVDAPKDKLRPIPVGISADLLVGQKVYAIGNPDKLYGNSKSYK